MSGQISENTTYQHLIMYGQSLSVGAQSYPLLSVENVPGNYMLGDIYGLITGILIKAE